MSDPERIGSVIAELSGDRICQRCGKSRFRKTLGPHPGGHYAKLNCEACDAFAGWLPKPKGEKARDPRHEVSRDIVKRFSRGFCELCKRAAEELPLPQVLEGHHVIEVQDGGSDEAANVWIICTPCHRQVHHLRVYLGHYHKRGADR